MTKINSLAIIIIINTITLLAQNDTSLDFWPAHKGDIWQYRSTFDNKNDHTTNIDSIIVDTLTKNTIIYEGGWSSNFYNHYRIDSIGNVYNRGSDSAFVRYKLYADSGDTWVSGFFNEDTVIGKVILVYNSIVFNANTIVKAYRFETKNFSFGTDHVAKSFGLIGTNGEGVSNYLSGAIINGIKYGAIVSVDEESSFPKAFDLITNYPNPFNNSTVISYTITSNSNLQISIYDILGKKIKDLLNEDKPIGTYKLPFNAENLSSGIYLLVLKNNSNILTHKISLIK